MNRENSSVSSSKSASFIIVSVSDSSSPDDLKYVDPPRVRGSHNLHTIEREQVPNPLGDPLSLGCQLQSRRQTLFIGLFDVLLSVFLEEETASIPAEYLERADFSSCVPAEEVMNRILVYKRPGLDEFLTKTARKYEVCVWTQACRSFAEPLIKAIDPKGQLISKCLFREHCTLDEARCAFKDIFRISDRSREHILLVDHNEHNTKLRPNNSIPIAPHGGANFFEDKELHFLGAILESAAELPDIRTYISRKKFNSTNKTK